MITKTKHLRISRVGVVLCTIYFVAFLAIALSRFEGSWGGFLLFVLSLPLSALILPAAGALNVSSSAVNLAFLITGVAWWYGVGYALERLVSKRKHR